MERFIFDGDLYYQQVRVCNTAGCKCHNDQPHGPYWWKRRDGMVTYVGRQLPATITKARERRERLRPAMASRERELRKQAAQLLHQAEALARLSREQRLASGDAEIIVELGFGDALTKMPQQKELIHMYAGEGKSHG